MTTTHDLALRDQLRTLRDALPPLLREAAGEPPAGTWLATLEHNVLPALDFELPVLLVAVCGGGSTGKSTLVNALAGRRVSQVAFRAGLTKRVLLVGHPAVLDGPEVAARLLHRLGAHPVPWTRAEDTAEAGPPLYATSSQLSPNLLLIDTPDFDTGEGGRLVNRELAEPILRTAEVMIYVFTNAVYNNQSNTAFMAEVVGGIGGRPTVLVYRVSRVATDAEVLEHCQVVARRLYGGRQIDGFPPEVIGVYRVHESDRVARGDAPPELLPISQVTAGRTLPTLLGELDVAEIKRHVFSADLRVIRSEADRDYRRAQTAASQAALYRDVLTQAMREDSLKALRAFPASEALALTARLFVETSPPLVRALRQTGVLVGAPFRGLRTAAQKVAVWLGARDEPPPPEDLHQQVEHDLLMAANAVRNRLLEEPLVIQVRADDPLLARARELGDAPDTAQAPIVEAISRGVFALQVPTPPVARQRQGEVLAADWATITQQLSQAAFDLVSLPAGIDRDLREKVVAFRQAMGWDQRLRETLFASLSALPPILGVTYALLTADPVSAASLEIKLSSILGFNDLWALVSIPASAGLTEQDRRQLEAMLKPVFEIWLEQRVGQVVQLFEDTICRPTLEALKAVPHPDDERFAAVARALDGIEGGS